MKIILVGGGKVGAALARQLSEEGHSVTVVDINKARVEQIVQNYDVLGVVGNGSSIATLSEAGIEDNDVFIAITGSDELNLLCCMFAKKAGSRHTIARVRNPSYSHELDFIRQQTGISAIINPEMAAAAEISRLLRFPGATKIDTFADGRVRLIKFALLEPHGLDGMPIRDIPSRLGCDILVCAVERGKTVTIPDGSFVLRSGDLVTFLATQEKAHQFFLKLGIPVKPVKNAMIVGGGAIAFYLSKSLAGPEPLRLSGRGTAPGPDSLCRRLQPQFSAVRGPGLHRGLCLPHQHGRGKYPAVPLCQQPLPRQAGHQDQPAGIRRYALQF